jgi:hypothetical protein
MTEQPAAAPPAGKQVPAPPSPDAAQERVEKLRAQLVEAEAAVPPPPGTVRLRVAGDHDSFTVAGFTVTKDPTPVPAHALAHLMGAAADAGVKIEEA